MSFMGELIGAIIFYLVLRLVFKILKGIYSFLFDSNNDQEPVIENTSIPIEDSEPVVENKEPVVENKEPVVEEKEPKPKYENTTYVFFKEEVYKAFEAYKAAGEEVSWESESDGFSLNMETQDSMEDETFSASVGCNNNNKLTSLAPYYLYITYSFTIKKDRFRYYENLANFLNDYYKTHNMLSKELFFAHSVFTIKYSDVGMYTCHIFLTDIFYLWRQTEALGEKHAFDRFFIMAKQKFTKGLELYKNRS